MSDKLKRKELKQPDAFQQAGDEAGAWVIERQKRVAIGVGAALLIGAVLGLGSYFSNRGESSASKELGAALKVISRPVSAVDPGPTSTEPAPFKTEAAKDEALAKALGDFRQQHASSRASVTAALPLAQASLRLGKYDEAMKAYDEYLKAAPANDPLRATALEGRGYTHEAKGEYDAAISAFDQLAQENKTEFLNGMGLYHRARMLILQGKKEEAAKQLSEIPAAAPSTAAARMASDRLSLLVLDGVKLAPPAPTQADGG